MNPKWGNLGKCGLEGTNPNKVLSKSSKVDTWLRVVQSALQNSDFSCSISKIISLKHALIPSAKANQHSMLKSQKPSCDCPKQQKTSKVKLTILS